MGNKKLLVNLVHKALLLVTLCFALWFVINPSQVALGQGFPGFPSADLPDVDGGLGFGPSVPPAGPGGFVTSPNPNDFIIGTPGAIDPATLGENVLGTPVGSATQQPNAVPQVVVSDSSFLASLHGFVIALFGRLLAIGGGLLSVGVSDFVVGFGEIYLNGGVGVVVESTWATVRDIFNLTFIFGLVYIGLRMILFTDDAQSKRGLGYLIAAALLINFSLFIIKFIIDISNSLATVIYRGFGGENLGNVFMNLLQMSSITNAGSLSSITSDTGLGLSYIFGVIIIVGVASFVFAAGGILLIIRFVVLNFYLIFSPVMFLGWVFPGLNKFSSQYWSGFLRNAFMAPAYIFALYFTFLLLGSYRYQLAPGTNLAQITTSTDYVSIGLAAGYYLLAIIMMVASIKVASNMGAFGASTVMSVGNSLRKGSQAVIYRNTAGRAAKGAMNVMDRTGASNNAMGRTLRRGLDKSYKYGAGGSSLAQARAQVDAEKKDIRANRIRMNQDEVSARRSTSTAAHLAALENETATVTQLNEAMEGLARNVRDMSNDERADLGIQQLTNHHVAANLTDAHITNLESSGQYSPDEINRIRAARRQAQINVAQTGFASATQTGTTATGNPVMEASNAAVRTGGTAAGHQTAQRRRLVAGGNTVIGNLPVAALAEANMLPLVTPRVVEERMRNGISEADRITLRDAVNSYITNPSTPAATTSLWSNWSTTRHEGMEFFR